MSKQRNKAMLNINPEALRREFEVRNLKLTEASVAMGYSETYLSKIMSRGKDVIPKTAAVLLENLYNIRPEFYIIPDPVSEPPAEWDPLAQIEPIDYDRLENLVFNAVYRAIKLANNPEE